MLQFHAFISKLWNNLCILSYIISQISKQYQILKSGFCILLISQHLPAGQYTKTSQWNILLEFEQFWN